MLIIDYTQLAPHIPFLRVLGLTLVERSVLAAAAAGFAQVRIAASPDVADRIRSILTVHPKVRIPVQYVAAVPDEPDACILPGNAVVTAAGMKGLWDGTLTVASLSADAMALIDGDDLRPAEKVLLNALRKQTDGIVSRHINRHISLFLSRRLARLPVHPNQITAVVFLIGMAAGPLAFFLNSYMGFLLAGLCYWVSAVLDGCDGEISRLKYQGSPLGAWLDTVVDDLAGLSFILGLYGRLALDQRGYWPVIGAATIALYLVTLLPRYWVMARSGSGDFQKLAAKKKPASVGGAGRIVAIARDVFFRTDFIPFYAFVTTAAGCLFAFAIPFSIGTVASAVDSIVDVIRVNRYRSQKP